MMAKMNAQTLFSHYVPYHKSRPIEDFAVCCICVDAKDCVSDSVFVAIPGSRVDGHDFLSEAVSRGARVLVVQNEKKIPQNFNGTVFLVLYSRKAISDLSARFFGQPSLELKVFGVTGTNGKSSTVHLIEHILMQVPLPTGVMGTINHHYKDKVWETGLTTSDPIALQGRLREMRGQGAEAVAMEVSSHAIDQHRVDHIAFHSCVLTNITRDHLDYHKTMENYSAAKEKLFLELLARSPWHPTFAIVNNNSRISRSIRIAPSSILWTYGKKDADFCYQIRKMSFEQTEFRIRTQFEEVIFQIGLIGEHSVENCVAAALVALSVGVPLTVSALALQGFLGVPGRLERVKSIPDRFVFVDYAHSPDALENVLKSLRKVRRDQKRSGGSEQKIWTVFGAGGDRDRGKRPLMGKVSENYSDFVVLTSDNPRTEDPQKILQDIQAGIRLLKINERLWIEPDRALAIQFAIQKSKPGDIVLIAGKGHENYQIIGNQKSTFLDSDVASRAAASHL